MTPDVTQATAAIHRAQAQLAIALRALGEGEAPAPDAPYPAACRDREPRPKPDLPPLGPAGSTFVDPTFGTPIVRVTDATLSGSSWRVPSNAHLSAWNADGTRFSIGGQAGTKVFAFEPKHGRARSIVTLRRPDALAAGAQRWAPITDPSARATLTGTIDVTSQCEPDWDRRDPAILYTVGGPQTRTIRAVTFDGDAIAHTLDVIDLDTLGLPLENPRTYVGGLLAAAELLVVFFGGEGQDRHPYVLWYPLNGAPALQLDTQARIGCYLHGVGVDLSGRYVFLYPASATPYQVIVWDTTTDTLTPVTQAPYGHDAIGFETWVNMDTPTGPWDAAQWASRAIAQLDAPRSLIDPVLTPKEVYLADHTSWTCAQPDRAVPVISSTYRFLGDPAAEPAPWRAWDDEVIAIATDDEPPADGESTVWRFCHHRSDVSDEQNPASCYFWYQPIPNVSPDGRWVLFTSNWEKTLGADPADPGRARQDVFLAAIG